MTENQQNIVTVLERADAIDRAEGLAAYPNYNVTMRKISDSYGVPLPAVVGAFCALSPNNDYMGNLRSLITILCGLRDGKDPATLKVSTYNSCKMRAWRCLEGEDFLSFTKGPKTRSFYVNIMDPDEGYHVTIDGHMFSVWSGKRFTMKSVATMGFRYNEVALDFRSVAFLVGLKANQIQAICWFAWKRIHRVVYNEQLGLFAGDDQWGLLPSIEEIRPFV